jgi:hypothetical protein
MAALAGLGTILTAVTLVWMLSVRLRDASIAVAGVDTTVLAGRGARYAVGRATLVAHLSP